MTASNEFQSQYNSVSQGANLNAYTPENQNLKIREALLRLQEKVGNLDEFVKDKLQYKNVETLHKCFMGLQVDAIALAIDNIENNNGLIIGDQTGVGKGRQAAAIIRYSRLHNHVPVFITKSKELFNDIYRDLLAIDEAENINPIIINADAVVTHEITQSINDEEFTVKKTVFKQSQSERDRAINFISNNGYLPKQYNCIFLTYSQISSANEGSIKRKLIEKIAPKSIFIMDESHTASGQRSKRTKLKGEAIIRTTGAGCLFNAIENTLGVTYLSATYAKRPDNLAIYYKTSLSDATDSIEDLVDAVNHGGLPLQSILSMTLTENGQLVRRERSFDGIEFQKILDETNTKSHHKLSDEFTKGLRAIHKASQLFEERCFETIPSIIEEIDTEAAEAVGSILDPFDFMGVVHILIGQMLLSIKANKTIELAISEFKIGRKPTIVLENTMGSFIDTLVEDGQAEINCPIDVSFKNILKLALKKTHTARFELPNHEIKSVPIPLDKMDDITRTEYKKAAKIIDELDINILPVSPIDYIKDELIKNSISIGEITGRKYYIETTPNGQTILRRRTPKMKNRTTSINGFNNKTYDALIFNSAGTTGNSLHHSNDFSDDRPRSMIISQLPADVNTAMQAFGRINRTGQKSTPNYLIPLTSLPIEIRQMALQEMKLSHLNAQTTSNSKSNTNVKGIVDMMNKYGDYVATTLLRDDKILANELGIELSGEFSTQPNAMRRLTGRMAILPCSTQSKLLEQLENEYTEYINLLNSTGQNDLIIETHALEAETLEKVIYAKGKGNSIFGSDVNIETVKANIVGKPPRFDEVLSEIHKHINKFGEHTKYFAEQAASDDSFSKKLTLKLKKNTAAFETQKQKLTNVMSSYGLTLKQTHEAFNDVKSDLPKPVSTCFKLYQDSAALKDSSEENLIAYETSEDYFLTALRNLNIGSLFRFNIDNESVNSAVVGINYTHNFGEGNPYAKSKLKIKFAINHSSRFATIALSQLNLDTFGTPTSEGFLKAKINQKISAKHFPGRTEHSPEKEKRTIATGNLVQASAELANKKIGGKVIKFSRMDGRVSAGVLLPRNFNVDSIPDRPLPVRTTNHSFNYLTNKNVEFDSTIHPITTRDSSLSISKHFDSFKVLIPIKSKSKNSTRVRLDEQLRKIAGKFTKEPTNYELSVGVEKLPQILDRLHKIVGLYIPKSAEVSHRITMPTTEKSKTNFGEGQSLNKLKDKCEQHAIKMIKEHSYTALANELSIASRELYSAGLPDWLNKDGDTITLVSDDDTPILTGYSRVVIGDYGAFIEFDRINAFKENVCAKKGQEYRYRDPEHKRNALFFWYTAKDESNIKIMFQQKKVSHSDFKPDKFYVSVFEVYPKNEATMNM